MHREISHADAAFHHDSQRGLVALTVLVGVLLAADLGPAVAAWGPLAGMGLPSWPREVLGVRFALVAAVLGGARVLYGSIVGLLEGRLGADLALAVAVLAAILLGQPVVAAEVVFIGLLGECLEGFTFERTRAAVRKLAEVFPIRCWRLENGQEVRVLTRDLAVGDRVVVKPGARVPADGVIVDGRSALDVSALTGEPLPVDRGPGDEVLAGSVNQFGALVVETRRVGEHTVAGRVIEMTARALKDKAPIERTADRLARYFLPVVLGLAAATFLAGVAYYVTGWLRPAGAVRFSVGEAARLAAYPALAVLVVACPCALILATPAAVLAALGRLAGTGILVKGGAALERLARVDSIAFDKTGTLTEGRLELGEVVGLQGHSAEEVLRTAAAAEARSEHPLARLIVRAAGERGVSIEPVEEFLAHPGAGVAVRVGGAAVLVGTPRLLREQGVALPGELEAELGRLDAAGQTALVVARDGRVLGVVGARDRVRPEAAAVVAELRGLGLGEVALLTGDRLPAARAVAESLGIEEVHAELLPGQKADYLAALKERGRRPAMVGDGINDAPALARADVGLAVAGADVAAEAGDILCLGDPLRHLPLLVRLSRQTVRIIRQNILIFALGVNVVGILLTSWLWPVIAPAGWYEQGPLAAVVYHQLGSLLVLLNAMRLLGFERASTSPAWQGLTASLARANAWAERALDAHAWEHWLADHWRAVVAGLAAVLLAGWGLSGLSMVREGEVGLVRRWGRVLDGDLRPGLHVRWPWPVEQVTRFRPGEVRTVELGFRSPAWVAALPAAQAWASSHGGEGIRRVADEAVMLTGDGNLIEVQATLSYTVPDPRAYLFDVSEPEAVLRSAAEAAVREVVAGRPFHDLLTTQRAGLGGEVLERLRPRVGSGGPAWTGAALAGLAIHDLHPPQEVVPAYHEVTRAMEARDRQVNQARADVLYNPRILSQSAELWKQAEQSGERTGLSLAEAEALALSTRKGAEAARQERVRGAEAGRDVFFSRRKARAGSEELTDFRLFWDTLGRALAGRDKVLVDAEQLPGRRNLLLIDPDQLRPPVVPGVPGKPADRPGLRPRFDEGEGR